MQFFFIVLVISFVIFLYRLYHLAFDDYILLKKNVSLEQMFNAAFVVSGVSLLFSRFLYVLLNPRDVLLSPLGFLLFPYFPGLSLTGAVLGGCVALLIYARSKRFPIGRAFDFFTAAFLSIIPVGFIGYFLLSRDLSIGRIVEVVLYTILSVFVTLYLFPRMGTLEIKDGTLSILFLIFFSLISLLSGAIDNQGASFVSQVENLILLGILLVSIGLLIKQEITTRMIPHGKQN